LQVLLGIPGHVAVDLPQHLEGADLTWVERYFARVRIEVPRDLIPALVTRQLRAGVRLLQALRQVVVEPAVGAAISRRFGSHGLPLQHALRVGVAAVVFRDLRRGEEKRSEERRVGKEVRDKREEERVREE